ncbi:MAG TPA: ATP-binding protein [Holophagaceae bacterium]|nr:ATP-binding protein [Holophagaceae bacterium]
MTDLTATSASRLPLHLLLGDLPGLATCLLDDLGRIREWTEGAQALMGHARSEALGRPAVELLRLPPGGLPALAPQRTEAWALLTRQDGSTFRARLIALPVPEGHLLLLHPALGTPQPKDETVRELMELRQALDESAIVAITDAKGDITYANDRFCRISQYNREELLGKNHRIINSGYHPKAFFTTLWSAIARGHVWRGEVKNRAKDGSYYWVDTTIVPFLDASGRPWQYMSIRFEITARKRVEEALLEKQAELEERAAALARSNADLEQFAYVASHDLQEPLRMVSSFTELLAKRYKGKLDSDADEFIDFAMQGALRMQVMIRDLLAYARLSNTMEGTQRIHLDDALDAALANLGLAVKEAAPTIRRFPLPVVMGDLSHLTLLYQNLLANALKFRSPDRPLELNVGAEREGGLWRCWVKDNGIGFDPKYAERIFTIFQRLHSRAEYPGSGIGLAFCKKIVERHGGHIRVESAPGEGATFHFTLPMDRSPS